MQEGSLTLHVGAVASPPSERKRGTQALRSSIADIDAGRRQGRSAKPGPSRPHRRHSAQGIRFRLGRTNAGRRNLMERRRWTWQRDRSWWRRGRQDHATGEGDARATGGRSTTAPAMGAGALPLRYCGCGPVDGGRPTALRRREWEAAAGTGVPDTLPSLR